LRKEQDRVVQRWIDTLDSAGVLLEEAKYVKVGRSMDSLLTEMCDHIESGPGAGSILGHAVLRRALAAAGQGDRDAALWDASVARSLEPTLAESDLARFGEAGKLIADYYAARITSYDLPEGSRESPLLGNEEGVTQPVRSKGGKDPKYPGAKSAACVEETVVLLMTIDPTGRPRDASLLTPHPVLGLAALDAIRTWKFKPATLEGEQVPVIYNLTVNYRAPACDRAY
jgi:TonB family protein